MTDLFAIDRSGVSAERRTSTPVPDRQSVRIECDCGFRGHANLRHYDICSCCSPYPPRIHPSSFIL